MANTSNRGEGQGSGAAREHAREATSHLQQAGTHAKEAASAAASGATQRAQDTGGGIGQRAQDVASSVAQRASDAASGVAQRASDLASSASDRADDTLSAVGQRMSSAAGTLRQGAPREGMLGSAAGAVADTLETGGRYLQQHGLGDVGDDLANLIRRNPVPSLLVAFGFGFLIGMGSRR